MRSSSSKLGKSVSISSDPVTENGPCTKKRLPTICIETVPSMPPSPTDWPPPPPEDTIPEEDETIDEGQIEIQLNNEEQEPYVPEEIRKFAANYIEELLVKAIELAEQKQKAEDAETAREIAARMVDDVISRASDTASERLSEKSFMVKYAEAPEEIREFAASYVKDIISRAVTMAEEKLVNTVPFNFEDADMMKVNGPWYIRVRETLMRVLRSACFCTPRRDDS